MVKQLLPTFIMLSVAAIANGQSKVANYFFGEAGTEQYEHFSFWANGSRRANIIYSYGVNRRETTITYLGKATYNNQQGFKIQFANHYILYIVPKQNGLSISDSTGKYNKIFSWEYEGPVNGIGTFCDVCTQDESEAMKLVKSVYVK
jgi:hypothetical protein